MLALRTTLSRSRRTFNFVSSVINNNLVSKTNCAANSTKYAAQHASLLSQQQRCYASKVTEDELKSQQRIYYGSLAPRMKVVKFFSLSTSLAGLVAQPILLEQGLKIGGTGMAVLLCTIGGFFTFVTPVLLHFVTKKYVTEIHYNPKTEEYTATTISIILRKIYTKFRVGDVKVPEVPGMFTSFTVDKRPLFVDPSMFDDPEHYVRMMGYDKPIDFKLEINDLDLKSQKAKKEKQ
ncbi:transmembrane protein 70 homolog, mitochondrial [Teleopsis dalmanni]|uniref:transmembrane protein 70 homolog, mitochondrial n=1 Tax=Teleopsis dalmanni TaxID=139649 RepID=UPI0018CF0D85|nr:transmembrane protein 70 homolog, mitochondrial [Teleopsis dalmanni]